MVDEMMGQIDAAKNQAEEMEHKIDLEKQIKILKESINSIQIAIKDQGRNITINSKKLEELDKFVRNDIAPRVNEQSI